MPNGVGRTTVRTYSLRGDLARVLRAHLLYLYRTELELGNLAVRVEHIVSEQVGGGLAEVEGNEHAAFRRAPANARFQDDRAAPGANPYQFSILHAKGIQIFRMDLDKWFRLDRVQGFR